MRLFGTITNLGQPGQTRTADTSDLRTGIGQLFAEAQTAVNRGGKVNGTLWMESSNLKGAAHVPILTLNVDAAKLPSLLLAMPAEAGQLALGDGTQRSAPAIVACPYCAGVADLVDAGEIVWRYRCDQAACGFESSFSPSQCAEWLGKSLIRSDRRRLEYPKDYNGKRDADAKPLLSFVDGSGAVKIAAVKKGYQSWDVQWYKSSGEKLDVSYCRKAKGEADARSLAKTAVQNARDIEYHDPLCEAAAPTNVWAAAPETAASLEGAFAQLKTVKGDVKVTFEAKGKTQTASAYNPSLRDGVVVIDYSVRVPASDVCRIFAVLDKAEYGPNAGMAILFQREGWTPPAPKEKPTKAKGKKKGAAAPDPNNIPRPASPIEAEQVRVLDAWTGVWANDNDAPHQAENESIYNDTVKYLNTLLGGAVYDAETYTSLLGEWQKAYPGVDPTATPDGCPTDSTARIMLLRAWLDVYDLDDGPTGEQYDALSDETALRIGDLKKGTCAFEDDHAIIARWQMVYPDVDPLTIGNASPADPNAILKRWHDVVLDDSQSEEDEVKIELLNDLETLAGETVSDLTPEERDALIARCQAAYPDVNPLVYVSEFTGGEGE